VAAEENAGGMEWVDLQDVLEGRGHTKVTCKKILFATAGFLRCYPMSGTVWIRCFCEDFANFVRDDYHAELAKRGEGFGGGH